jgi:hypothetical protein
MTTDSTLSHREIYFEITRIGGSAKVAAIDGATGVEACVAGPAQAEGELRRLALARLEALIAKEP